MTKYGITYYINNLTDAICAATIAHKDQKRDNGFSYILHPIRVMMQMTEEKEMICAVLHDVEEDSNIIISFNMENAHKDAKEMREALDLLNKNGKKYDRYIADLAENKLARKVKISDLRDNSNLNELTEINDYKIERTQKYIKALAFLTNKERENEKAT